MAKDKGVRLEEALTSISSVDKGLGMHVRGILRGLADGDRDRISESISLSGKTPWFGGQRANDTKSQRDALRGLLLCQRVYFTNLWAPHLADDPTVPDNGEWPDVTLDHWRFMPGLVVRSGIAMFAPMPNVREQALAEAAKVRSDNPDSCFTAKRSSRSPPVGISCFDQVSHWLLSAGYVSLRWIMRYKPSGIDFTPFGARVETIREADPMPRGLIRIPRGMIIYMYTEMRKGGHFMVSDGEGWGWGFNNSPLPAGDGEGLVPNGHARCLIHRQFAQYRSEEDRRLGAMGKLVVFDPGGIQNRC